MNDHLHRELALVRAEEARRQAMGRRRAAAARRRRPIAGPLRRALALRGRATGRGAGAMTALRLRLRVWRRRHALTEALADGADPDASAELTFVAGELIGMGARQRLAAAVDRLLHAAAHRTVPWSSAGPLNKNEIEDAHDELSELAERLREARPVPVHAVARVVMLLSDGTGPLYGRGTPRHAWALARTARLALDDPIA